MAAFIKTADHLTVVFDDGESSTVYPSNPNYKNIVAALVAKDYSKVRSLSTPVLAIKDKIAIVNKRVGSKVEFIGGQVYYNGNVLHNTLTDRIVEMSTEGFDIGPMVKFLENLKQNPSFRAVNELYGFLEKGNLPITDDGHFIAYKKVRNDYTDCHTGKMDNSVGKVPEMPRNEVNEDPEQTCEAGLHFCSRDYLGHFDGQKTMILKVNPADVVAIPVDYNQTKGRACRYEVIGELGHESEKLEGAFRPSADYVEPTDDSSSLLEDECSVCGETDCGGYDCDYDDEVRDEDDYGHIDAAFVERADGSLVLALSGEVVEETIQMIDLETGQVLDTYPSLKEAADDNGLTPSAIRRVLKGERKSTGGWGWSLVKLAPKSTNSAAHPEHLANQHQHGSLKGGNPHTPGPYDNFIAVATDDGDRWPYDNGEDELDDEDRGY